MDPLQRGGGSEQLPCIAGRHHPAQPLNMQSVISFQSHLSYLRLARITQHQSQPALDSLNIWPYYYSILCLNLLYIQSPFVHFENLSSFDSL